MITWDDKKRQQVIRDHGIDFRKLHDAFLDEFAIYEAQEDWQHTEQRWLLIAKSSEYGLVAIVYTFSDDDIRLITARRAEKWMGRLYEKQKRRI